MTLMTIVFYFLAVACCPFGEQPDIEIHGLLMYRVKGGRLYLFVHLCVVWGFEPGDVVSVVFAWFEAYQDSNTRKRSHDELGVVGCLFIRS